MHSASYSFISVPSHSRRFLYHQRNHPAIILLLSGLLVHLQSSTRHKSTQVAGRPWVFQARHIKRSFMTCKFSIAFHDSAMVSSLIFFLLLLATTHCFKIILLRSNLKSTVRFAPHSSGSFSSSLPFVIHLLLFITTNFPKISTSFLPLHLHETPHPLLSTNSHQSRYSHS